MQIMSFGTRQNAIISAETIADQVSPVRPSTVTYEFPFNGTGEMSRLNEAAQIVVGEINGQSYIPTNAAVECKFTKEKTPKIEGMEPSRGVVAITDIPVSQKPYVDNTLLRYALNEARLSPQELMGPEHMHITASPAEGLTVCCQNLHTGL